MDEAPHIFDAHLHPEGLSDQDLESLRYFGVESALVPAHHFPEATARALLEHFDDIVEKQLPRLKRAGIRAYAALGVHPDCIPHRGLSTVLAKLPDYFRGGRVVAVGAVGMKREDREEEEAFVEQVALARRLKLPVFVLTPQREKAALTRRLLALIRETAIPPARVLIDGANGSTVKLILECGHFAGLTVHPDALTAERAATLIRRLGTERVVLTSSAGDGASEMLALPRLVSLLERAKLSTRVIDRVARLNAQECLRLEP